MVGNRWVLFVTIGAHVLVVTLALLKLALQEYLRHQLLERYAGVLIGGGVASTSTLWTIDVRLLQLLSMQTVLLHAVAIPLSRRLFIDPYSRHLNGLSHLWSALTAQCLLANLLAAVLFVRFADSTHNSIADTLRGGLEMFQFDDRWADFWNELQTNHRCCGVRKHADWHEMVWPTAEQEAQFRRLLTDSTVLVPISCCRKRVQRRPHCAGERINLGATQLLRSTDPNTSAVIHHAGCLDAVTRSTFSSTSRAVETTLDATLCSTQLVTVIAMRMLFIVNRNFQTRRIPPY